MGKMKANRKFVEGEEAVSAVIGVILMVAITVAIAATVYVYVSGMLPSGGSVTPSITVSPNDIDNTLLVTGADPSSANWENINISIISPTSGVHYYTWINLSSIAYSSGGGVHAPSNWGVITAGNSIQVGFYGQKVSVSMRWIPTNKLIGTYTFNT